MTDIAMPQLSDSMEEGTILTWLKSDGEQVERGEELVEIETDKATMTYESPETGVLTIVAEEGSTLPVGEPIARIGERAEAPAEELEPAPEALTTSLAAPPAPAIAKNGHGDPAEVSATPVARRVAAHHGVNLAEIDGSGPRGRITRADVAAKAGLPEPVAVPEVAPPPPAHEPAPTLAPNGAKGETTIVELTRLQQVVARRMTDSKATVPHFQVETEVQMDQAITVRARLKEQAGESPAPSYNDMIVKAAALALREHPRANGSYRDGQFELHGRINVGVAVAADDALIVPTVADADTKSLGQIGLETRRLAELVRTAEITPPQLSGATFTVSNLGMFGMTAITPVVNPPQAAILGVGALRAVPGLIDGKLVEHQLLTLTLSCDHRILYGADAARFLSTIRDLLEQPLRLAL